MNLFFYDNDDINEIINNFYNIIKKNIISNR